MADNLSMTFSLFGKDATASTAIKGVGKSAKATADQIERETARMNRTTDRIGTGYNAASRQMNASMRGMASTYDGVTRRVNSSSASMATGFRGATISGQGMASALQTAFSAAERAVAITGVAAAGLVALTAKVGVQTYSMTEQAAIGFETLLGSVQAAQAEIAKLQEFAKTTPFEMTGLVQMDRMLVGVGISADKTLRVLTTWGNIASANALSQEQFNRVMIANAQIIGKNKVMLEDLNQVTENGIYNVRQLLADGLGVSVPQLLKMIEEGKVSAEQYLTVLDKVSDEKYANSMLKQSKTLAGTWSNVKDVFAQGTSSVFGTVADDITQALTDIQPVMKTILDGTREWLDESGNARKFGDSVDRVVSSLEDITKNDVKEFLDGVVDGTKTAADYALKVAENWKLAAGAYGAYLLLQSVGGVQGAVTIGSAIDQRNKGTWIGRELEKSNSRQSGQLPVPLSSGLRSMPAEDRRGLRHQLRSTNVPEATRNAAGAEYMGRVLLDGNSPKYQGGPRKQNKALNQGFALGPMNKSLDEFNKKSLVANKNSSLLSKVFSGMGTAANSGKAGVLGIAGALGGVVGISGPVVLIAAGVAALAAGFIWAYKSVQPFHDMVVRVGKYFKTEMSEAFSGFTKKTEDGTSAIDSLKSVVAAMTPGIEFLARLFIDNLARGIKVVAWVFTNVLKPVMDWAVDVFKRLTGQIGSVLRALASAARLIPKVGDDIARGLETAAAEADKFSNEVTASINSIPSQKNVTITYTSSGDPTQAAGGGSSSLYESQVPSQAGTSPGRSSGSAKAKGGNAQKAYSMLLAAGYTSNQAIGIVGNLIGESGRNIDPTIKQTGGGPGRGIAQWSVGERWQDLLKWTRSRGLNPMSLEGQMRFLIQEMGTANGGYADKAVRSQSSVLGASAAFMRKFERPKDQSDAAARRRANYGLAMFNQGRLKDIPAPKSDPTPKGRNPGAPGGYNLPPDTSAADQRRSDAAERAAQRRADEASRKAALRQNISSMFKKVWPNRTSEFKKAMFESKDSLRQAFGSLMADLAEYGSKQGQTAARKAFSGFFDQRKLTGPLKSIYKNSRTASLYSQYEAVQLQIERQQTRLANAKEARSEMGTSVRENILSTGTLTGSNGTFSGIIYRLTAAVANAKRFSSAIVLLRKRGLSNSLLQQLIEAGPEAGLRPALSLLAAGVGGVKQVNDLQNRLSRQATSTGSSVSKAYYDVGINATQGLLNGLKKQEKAIENQMSKIADSMIRAIKKALGIKSPSTRMRFEVGQMAAQGAVLGIRDMIPMARLAGDDLAESMVSTKTMVYKKSSMAGYTPAPPVTNEYHFHGFVGDEDKVVREIERRQKRVNARTGNK